MTWDNKKFGSACILRPGRRRSPLRAFEEFCHEFGETIGVMRALVRDKAGPKPVLKTKGSTNKTYYDPQEFREWYASLKREKQ